MFNLPNTTPWVQPPSLADLQRAASRPSGLQQLLAGLSQGAEIADQLGGFREKKEERKAKSDARKSAKMFQTKLADLVRPKQTQGPLDALARGVMGTAGGVPPSPFSTGPIVQPQLTGPKILEAAMSSGVKVPYQDAARLMGENKRQSDVFNPPPGGDMTMFLALADANPQAPLLHPVFGKQLREAGIDTPEKVKLWADAVRQRQTLKQLGPALANAKTSVPGLVTPFLARGDMEGAATASAVGALKTQESTEAFQLEKQQRGLDAAMERVKAMALTGLYKNEEIIAARKHIAEKQADLARELKAADLAAKKDDGSIPKPLVRYGENIGKDPMFRDAVKKAVNVRTSEALISNAPPAGSPQEARQRWFQQFLSVYQGVREGDPNAVREGEIALMRSTTSWGKWFQANFERLVTEKGGAGLADEDLKGMVEVMKRIDAARRKNIMAPVLRSYVMGAQAQTDSSEVVERWKKAYVYPEMSKLGMDPKELDGDEPGPDDGADPAGLAGDGWDVE